MAAMSLHTSDGEIEVAPETSYGSGNYLLESSSQAAGNGGGSGWVLNILPPRHPDED
jgi:hypothetical protein